MTNKHDEAIAAFYTEDATLQEPGAEPRGGLAQLRTVSEVTIQEWRGDKICRERFFYDKASAAWKSA